MLFGNPSIFAVEAHHERPPDFGSAGVWGRMCLHIRGSQFGDIHESCCSLDHAFEALSWLASHTDSLWDEDLGGLTDWEVYELLDTSLYRDDDRSLEQVLLDSRRFIRFSFLTNWGEQFDSTPKPFIFRVGSDIRVIWRDGSGEQFRHDFPISDFITACADAHSWYLQEIVTYPDRLRGVRGN